jgi:hypothetical protein
VREDDADPELLDNEDLQLEEGSLVAMAVKEAPLSWRTFPEDVELSEGGVVATQVLEDNLSDEFSHITTGVELTEGRYYWEVELVSVTMHSIYVGVTRPNLDPEGTYMHSDCTDGWFILTNGCLYGNGKYGHDGAGRYKQGDRVGVLLDLNNGSLLFFKNGVQNGPGYPASYVTGPVVAAVEMGVKNVAVRLHADVAFPAGHVQ